MKKVICALLAAVMCFMMCTALAESSDTVTISCSLTEGMNYTSAEWVETSFTRAELTWMLLLDYTSAGYSLDDVDAAGLQNNSYVAYGASDVFAVFFPMSNGDYTCIYYTPGYSSATVGTFEDFSSSAVEQMVEKAGDTCYLNSSSEMLAVAELIQQALNS